MTLQSGGLLRAALVAGAGLALVAMPLTADAGVVYSNVSISGSLGSGGTFVTGPNDIDFNFVSAIVGDAQPARSGNIIITYIASSDDGGSFSRMDLSVLGATLGSGTVVVNEVIEDLITPGIIASFGAVYTDSSGHSLPQTAEIQLSRSSTKVKVKKTFVLVAPETANLDVASVSLVEQRLVPSPGSAALIGLSGLIAVRRRRA